MQTKKTNPDKNDKILHYKRKINYFLNSQPQQNLTPNKKIKRICNSREHLTQSSKSTEQLQKKTYNSSASRIHSSEKRQKDTSFMSDKIPQASEILDIFYNIQNYFSMIVQKINKYYDMDQEDKLIVTDNCITLNLKLNQVITLIESYKESSPQQNQTLVTDFSKILQKHEKEKRLLHQQIQQLENQLQEKEQQEKASSQLNDSQFKTPTKDETPEKQKNTIKSSSPVKKGPDRWTQVYKMLSEKKQKQIQSDEKQDQENKKMQIQQLQDELNQKNKQLEKNWRELKNMERQNKNFQQVIDKCDKEKQKLQEIIKEQRAFELQQQTEIERLKKKSQLNSRKSTFAFKSPKQSDPQFEVQQKEENQLTNEEYESKLQSRQNEIEEQKEIINNLQQDIEKMKDEQQNNKQENKQLKGLIEEKDKIIKEKELSIKNLQEGLDKQQNYQNQLEQELQDFVKQTEKSQKYIKKIEQQMVINMNQLQAKQQENFEQQEVIKQKNEQIQELKKKIKDQEKDQENEIDKEKDKDKDKDKDKEIEINDNKEINKDKDQKIENENENNEIDKNKDKDKDKESDKDKQQIEKQEEIEDIKQDEQ